MENRTIRVGVTGKESATFFLGWTVHGLALLCKEPLFDELLELEIARGRQRIYLWGRAVWHQRLSRDGQYVVSVSSLVGQDLAQSVLKEWREQPAAA